MANKPKAFRPAISSLLGNINPEELRELEQHRWEEEVVQLLLARYQIPVAVKYELLRDAEQLVGKKRLLLEIFLQRFPGFPLGLFAQRFSKIQVDSPVHKLFMDFSRRQFAKEYAKLAEAVPEGRTEYGLVFFWPFMQRGKLHERGAGLILHNCGQRSNYWTPGTLMQSTGLGGEVLYLEPFHIFLAAMDGWSGREWMDG